MTKSDIKREEEDYLRGNPARITQALKKSAGVGVRHVALQFMVPRWPERQAEVERFAREVLPAFKAS